MMETVDGSGAGGVFVDENQASCGPILPTVNLHLSHFGAVLQQAREPVSTTRFAQCRRTPGGEARTAPNPA